MLYIKLIINKLVVLHLKSWLNADSNMN